MKIDENGMCALDDEDYSYHTRATNVKRTNGDRIRAMTDEELTVFLELTVPRPWCASPCRQGDIWNAKCELCVFDWLKQEAEP